VKSISSLLHAAAVTRTTGEKLPVCTPCLSCASCHTGSVACASQCLEKETATLQTLLWRPLMAESVSTAPHTPHGSSRGSVLLWSSHARVAPKRSLAARDREPPTVAARPLRSPSAPARAGKHGTGTGERCSQPCRPPQRWEEPAVTPSQGHEVRGRRKERPQCPSPAGAPPTRGDMWGRGIPGAVLREGRGLSAEAGL